jgi:hypothetical protein
MPIELGHSRLVLLDVLADPPILVFFEKANSYTFGSTSYGKLVFYFIINIKS